MAAIDAGTYRSPVGSHPSVSSNTTRPKRSASNGADYCDPSTGGAEADRMRGYIESIHGASEEAEALQRRYRALGLPVPRVLTEFLNAVARAGNLTVVRAFAISAELVDAAGRAHHAILTEHD